MSKRHDVALFGLAVPGRSNKPPYRDFRPGTNIPDARIDVVTLRTTLPDPTTGEVRKYLRASNESGNFVFDRDDSVDVIGLDIDEDGNEITWQGLQNLLKQDALELQVRQAATRAANAVPEDELAF